MASALACIVTHRARLTWIDGDELRTIVALGAQIILVVTAAVAAESARAGSLRTLADDARKQISALTKTRATAVGIDETRLFTAIGTISQRGALVVIGAIVGRNGRIEETRPACARIALAWSKESVGTDASSTACAFLVREAQFGTTIAAQCIDIAMGLAGGRRYTAKLSILAEEIAIASTRTGIALAVDARLAQNTIAAIVATRRTNVASANSTVGTLAIDDTLE